jgi:DegV family protein with EDD domain
VTGRRVALVVDSGAALEDRVEGGLAVVPIHVVVGNDTLDGLADGEVYRRLRRGEKATSSTPSPGEYLAVFQRLSVRFDAIICLTIPARWSGTFDSATVAAELFADAGGGSTLDIVETPTAAVGYGLVARVANALCDAGADRDAVLSRIERACREVRMYGALETLEYVARSGRVPALVAGVSDALHVRPVFEMHGGATGRVGLARTESGVLRALERVATERLEPGRPQWLMLFHADAADIAGRLRERLLVACAVERDETVALAPVIGVHTGPGAVGFAALPIHETDPPPVGA